MDPAKRGIAGRTENESAFSHRGWRRSLEDSSGPVMLHGGLYRRYLSSEPEYPLPAGVAQLVERLAVKVHRMSIDRSSEVVPGSSPGPGVPHSLDQRRPIRADISIKQRQWYCTFLLFKRRRLAFG